MNNEQALAVFENYHIRRAYDSKAEKWYVSVVDVLEALIQQPSCQAARNYWKALKNRLTREGSESVAKCNRLKLIAADGKSCFTDVPDPETLPRLVQSVPSPKAEPSTRQTAEAASATGLAENTGAGRKGGRIARKARLELESKTGKTTVTGENFLPSGDQPSPRLKGGRNEK